MKTWYGDFHIHIGRANGRPVKMAASASLTLDAIIHHARLQKGLDIVTVIDGVCPVVQGQWAEYVRDGRLRLQTGGGYIAENGLVLIPGAEIEIRGPFGGAAHFGCWFRDMDRAKSFSDWLKTVQKNPNLSSQVARVDARTLQKAVKNENGLFIVHHAFTPHKGLYGNCVKNMTDMLDVSLVDALELGLSADSEMADTLSELRDITFLSNSDAHSVKTIAREYNRLALDNPSFDEVRAALHRENGRGLTGNFGLHPALGKYHRTRCRDCGRIRQSDTLLCECGSKRFVRGVFDRHLEIRDLTEANHPSHRPPYVHQVPLSFVPGLGPKALEHLLDAFGTEMAILHSAAVEDLSSVVGQVLAQRIDLARQGLLSMESGGAGTYGRLLID